jgi:dolichyl-phosphate beta-glucosyltransferase
MRDQPYLSVVIPAYNEERRLLATLLRIEEYLEAREEEAEIVVVDDGSRDATLRLARERAEGRPDLVVLANDRNRGKGFSVRRGFLAARGERVLVTDADLSTPVEDVEKLEEALAGGGDFAIGSRALSASEIVVHQPPWRERMGRHFNRLVRILARLDVRDSQCGFKLFERERCAPLFSRGRLSGFAWDVEVLVIARRLGLRWSEVPVRWYDSVPSRVRPLRHAAQMFRDLLRVRLAEWRGAYDREPAAAAP